MPTTIKYVGILNTLLTESPEIPLVFMNVLILIRDFLHLRI